MPINPMAWVASSTSFLLVTAGSLWEAPSVVRPAAIQLGGLSATTYGLTTPVATNPVMTNIPVMKNIPGLMNTSVIKNTTIKNTTLATAFPASLLSQGSLDYRPNDQNKFSTIVHSSQRALLNCPSTADRLWTQSTPGMFPVFLKGCRVAELSHQSEANYLQQRLLQLSQDPNLDWQKDLQPGFVNQTPTIRFGEEVLVKVSDQTADRLDQHAQTLAIQWINNIRQIMGARPISMDSAQKQMYNLQETPDTSYGAASWYGPYFHGRLTANGEVFNQYDLTAAHRDLPLGSFVKVTNRQNGRTVVVRINDRGPYHDEENRVIDLSYQAAKILDSEDLGIIPIEMVVLKTAPQPRRQPQVPRQQTIALLQ